MKRNILLLSLVLCFAMTNAQPRQNLRDHVGIIRTCLDSADVSLIRNTIDNLKENTYYTASYVIESQLNSFGSGFVCKDADGKRYVLTNYHNTGHANMLTFEIQHSDGSRSIDSCRVLKVMEECDLTLCELPADSAVEDGLILDLGEISDGEEVYSAGYPGIGLTPSWQFGKGIVSNSLLNRRYLDSIEVDIIQHTAQLDAGSSGGPLLRIVHNGDSLAYAVIGINSWKAVNRENTNLALPSSNIRQAIDSSDIYDDRMTSVPTFEESLIRFADNFTGNPENDDLLDHIGKELSFGLSPEMFKECLYNALPETKMLLRSGDIKGLQKMVIDYMQINAGYPEDMKLISFSQDDGTAVFEASGKPVYTKWRQNWLGQWTLASCSLMDAPKIMSNKGLERFNGVVTSMDMGMFKSPQGLGAFIGIEFSYKDIIFGFDLNNIPTDNLPEYSEAIAALDQNKSPSISIAQVNVGYYYPVCINSFYLAPFVKASAGVYQIEGVVKNKASCALDAGSRIGYVLSHATPFYLTASYSCQMLGKKAISLVKIGLGYAF